MSQKKKFQIPHVFVMLVMFVIVATAMTYIIPAGEFARVKNEATGKMIVDATSFTWVEQCPVSFFKIPNYIVKALAGSSLIWMTIFSAASIEVILATGAFDAAINIMIHKYKSSEKLLLIGTIIVFGIYGMRQNPVSMIGFIPVLVLFCRMCGYDAWKPEYWTGSSGNHSDCAGIRRSSDFLWNRLSFSAMRSIPCTECILYRYVCDEGKERSEKQPCI